MRVTTSTFTVTWGATDAQAGVAWYDLDVSVDGSPWQRVLTRTLATTYVQTCTLANFYTFRLTATDRVSNAVSVAARAGVPRVTKYYHHGGVRIALRAQGVVYYLHTDHLGSVSLVTDHASRITARQRFLPYGTVRWSEGTLPTDFGFAGQRTVLGTGLVFMHARFYHPALGRFTQADTIVPSPGNPQDLNRYTYARNSPLSYADPSGHFPFLIGLAGGLLGGAAYGYGKQVVRNLQQGMSFGDALTTNIDPVEIACYTVAGGVLGSGVWAVAAVGGAVLGSEVVAGITVKALGWAAAHPVQAAVGKAVAEEAIEAGLTGTEFDPAMVLLDVTTQVGDDLLPRRYRQYSVAYEMELDPADYGAARSTHNLRANAALQGDLQSDTRFAADMENLIPGVGQAVSRGRTPNGWQWHHTGDPTDSGGVRMQLVPKYQHSYGSPWWDVLHPGGVGGYRHLRRYRTE